MRNGCVPLVAAPITFWISFTLSSQGEAGVGKGQKAIPTLVEVTVSQSGTNEVHFSERPCLRTLQPSVAPQEIIPAKGRNTPVV